MIHSTIRQYPAHVLTDSHDFHQVFIGLRGAVDIEVEGRGARVTRGIACVIPRDRQHHYLAHDGDNNCRVLDIGVDALDAVLPDAGRLFDTTGFLQLPQGVDGTGETLSLLIALATLCGPATRSPRLNLARLLRYVDARLDQPLSVPGLARVCSLGERAFTRQFRALTGCTPHAWLRLRRLDQAVRLLRDTSRPISEIALACGFADASHLTHVFRQVRGTSPGVFRRDTADLEPATEIDKTADRQAVE